MICPTRSVYIIYNDKISSDIGRYFFDDSNTGLGRRIGDIMIDAKNEAPKTNNLRFTIIGDPAMRIKIPRNIAEVTEIAGNEVTRDVDEEELPVLQARSRSEIKGVIRTPEGEVDNSFNGKIEIILYDAEKAVETNIDPTYQKDTFIYNTHATTLYRGIAKVEGGLWSTSLIIPEEIENLTSKARVSLYAYTDEGTEAHGSFENFYIYGYDNNAPDDNEGPKIHYFASAIRSLLLSTAGHTSTMSTLIILRTPRTSQPVRSRIPYRSFRSVNTRCVSPYGTTPTTAPRLI